MASARLCTVDVAVGIPLLALLAAAAQAFLDPAVAVGRQRFHRRTRREPRHRHAGTGPRRHVGRSRRWRPRRQRPTRHDDLRRGGGARSDRRLPLRRAGARGHGARGVRRAAAAPGRDGRSTRSSAASGASSGTMYFCRERWDTANDPACNGQQANPVTTPNFHSTCWSNHARGRAIDVMVGTARWRLQHDTRPLDRQLAARPRRPGQRQLQRSQARHPADPLRRSLLEQRRRPRHRLVDGDAPVRHRPPRPRPPRPHDQRRQRQRVVLGRAPVFVPKIDTQVFWDSQLRLAAGGVVVEPRRRPTRRARRWALASIEPIVGDFSGDGVQDEIIVWDRQQRHAPRAELGRR